jgi:hypothetical protein
MDIPLWLSILLFAIGAVAIVAVLYLLMLTAMRQALREPLAEMRAARRKQEDLLRDISGSATYLADVADVWAESEADRRAAQRPAEPSPTSTSA